METGNDSKETTNESKFEAKSEAGSDRVEVILSDYWKSACV